MKTDPRAEIVELIDDGGVDAFGDDARRRVAADVEGRPWVGALTGAVLVAVVGYGVVTSASSNDGPGAASIATSSTALIASRPGPSTAEIGVPFLAADPPQAFSVHYANLQKVDRSAFQGYTYELWATKDAAAGTGSWFSITTYRGASSLRTPNAYRVRTDRATIAISHVRSGHSVAQLVTGGVAVSIASFGWSDDDLVRLAGSVRADGRTIGFADSWFTADHALVTGVQPWPAAQGFPAEQVSYTSADDPGSNIVITVGQRLDGSAGGSNDDRDVALRFLLEGPTTFDVNGAPAIAGTIVGRNDSMATWLDHDNVITVSAPMPVPELIEIARTVHRVSSTDWEAMKLTALRFNSPRAAIVRSQASSIASGTDDNSVPWKIGVTMSYSGSRHVNWWWEGSGFGSAATDGAEINTVVDDDRTYVLADLPRSITTAAKLEITRAGLEPVVVPFVDAGARMDRTFAAYAFSDATRYTAQVVGDDGTVLAAWPST